MSDKYGYDLVENTTGVLLRVIMGEAEEPNSGAQVSLAAGNVTSPAVTFTTDPDTGLYLSALGTLSVAIDSTQRAAFSSAGMLLNGLLTGTAVTQSATDTTAGRLLKVGDYGIGGAAGTIGSLSVTDNSLGTGPSRYDTTAGSSGGPTGSLSGEVYHTRTASGETQKFTVITGTGTATPGTIWVRYRNSGAWTTWTLVGPVANVVSATSGSNANGRYWTLSCGLQICIYTSMTTQPSAISWTYPAAFTAIPAISYSVYGTAGGGNYIISLSGLPTTTSATLATYNSSGSTGAASLAYTLTAIGPV